MISLIFRAFHFYRSQKKEMETLPKKAELAVLLETQFRSMDDFRAAKEKLTKEGKKNLSQAGNSQDQSGQLAKSTSVPIPGQQKGLTNGANVGQPGTSPGGTAICPPLGTSSGNNSSPSIAVQ